MSHMTPKKRGRSAVLKIEALKKGDQVSWNIVLKGEDLMVIKVLGSGCANCKRLEENVKAAVRELGIEATIEKVTDFKDILGYGVMKTPGLVVDERVKAMGRVPTVEEIKKYII